MLNRKATKDRGWCLYTLPVHAHKNKTLEGRQSRTSNINQKILRAPAIQCHIQSASVSVGVTPMNSTNYGLQIFRGGGINSTGRLRQEDLKFKARLGKLEKTLGRAGETAWCDCPYSTSVPPKNWVCTEHGQTPLSPCHRSINNTV